MASEGSGLACISVTRTNQGIATLRHFRVLVDGVESGGVRKNKTILLSVDPGEHDVQVYLDRLRTPVLRVDVAANQRVHLEVGQRQQGFWSLAAPIQALIRPSRVLYLRRVSQAPVGQ
jgi:hypothetical protein